MQCTASDDQEEDANSMDGTQVRQAVPYDIGRQAQCGRAEGVGGQKALSAALHGDGKAQEGVLEVYL